MLEARQALSSQQTMRTSTSGPRHKNQGTGLGSVRQSVRWVQKFGPQFFQRVVLLVPLWRVGKLDIVSSQERDDECNHLHFSESVAVKIAVSKLPSALGQLYTHRFPMHILGPVPKPTKASLLQSGSRNRSGLNSSGSVQYLAVGLSARSHRSAIVTYGRTELRSQNTPEGCPRGR